MIGRREVLNNDNIFSIRKAPDLILKKDNKHLNIVKNDA